MEEGSLIIEDINTYLKEIDERDSIELVSTTTVNPSSTVVKVLMETTTSLLSNHTENVKEFDKIYFSVVDYIIFVLLLGISAIIGIYFGFISKKKQNNTAEYLLGGKTMKTFPISASLIASHVSGITMLGVPAEMYANGTQYWVHVVCVVAVGVSMIYIYLPVFYDLQLTSCFGYLEKRFDRSVKLTASLVFAVSCIVFIPIVIYVPALAFNQVTGINLHIITPVISIVCIFYTTIGGLRAVVWTDTLQLMLMLGASIAVIALGIASVGGFFDVWEIAERGKRLVFFNMDPNPLLRTSFWTVSIGLSSSWIASLGVNQSCVQRFLAVPDIRLARRSVWIFCLGLLVIKGLSCFTGLLMYAHYEKCDPLTTGRVKKLDQMLPYYVMDVAGQMPGLPGLFIAGIFSAALSSMSSSLNTLAGTLYEDFFRPYYPNVSEKSASNTMKVIVLVLGAIELALVFVVEHLGAVFTMTISIGGLTSGTLLGIFTIGMIFRRANTKGVITGSIVSLLVVSWIIIGAQTTPKTPYLTLRTDGCLDGNQSVLTTSTPLPTISSAVDDSFWLYRISFMYYTVVGLVVMFVVGYPVSLLTGGPSEDIDEILLTPFCRSREYREKRKADKATVNPVSLSDVLRSADNMN